MVQIHSLWIGGPLSMLERLCITSHLKNGHKYHLWTYEPIEAPEGVIVKDGNEILPESEIFCYSGSKEEGGGSVSAFSNIFRYKLLSEQEVWWCDTDVVCLKPFDFEEEIVLATEDLEDGGSTITSCVIKAPKSIMQDCYNQSMQEDRATLKWGVIGPSLLKRVINQKSLSMYCKSPSTFCPIPYYEIDKIFQPTLLKQESYAVHLWNEIWRRKEIDKNSTGTSGCLYEALHETYGSSTPR